MDGTLCLSYTGQFLDYVMWHNYINQYLSFYFVILYLRIVLENELSPHKIYMLKPSFSVWIYLEIGPLAGKV